MNLPTIMRTTQESLKTVPQSYREGAFGLGAGKWRVVRTVVLPGCVDGIVTGCILSVGRILGETAALLYTAGFAHTLHGFSDGLRNAGATLTVALYVYAKEQVEYGGQDIFAPSVDVNGLRRRIGTVFQKPNPFPMSIYDNVAYGPRTHGVTASAPCATRPYGTR